MTFDLTAAVGLFFVGFFSAAVLSFLCGFFLALKRSLRLTASEA